MINENALQILLRRIPAEAAIRSWLEDNYPRIKRCKNEYYIDKGIVIDDDVDSDIDIPYNAPISKSGPLCLYPKRQHFQSALQNEFNHYSVDEAEYVYQYAKQESRFKTMPTKNYGIFGLIANSVGDMLITDAHEECLCKYKSLLSFRELTHPIDPLIFIAAYLAKHDIDTGFERKVFSWSPTVRTDNTRLYHMLDHGMSENHFHIGGSSNAFMFSWICLMNHYSIERRKEFEEWGADDYPLASVYVDHTIKFDSSYVLIFKAFCIRYFLYQRLMGRWVVYPKKDDRRRCDDICTITQENTKWIAKIMAITDDDECDYLVRDIDTNLEALRALCASNNEDNFIPDYAMFGEPLPPLNDDDKNLYSSEAVRNYERRLYRPFSGEQRFLYFLFRAVYTDDKKIIPYLDLAYAYLLIYCRVRSELIQVNNRVGFGNFLKYQDRKEIFTGNWPQYDNMRSLIAQQVVLSNPQIVSFEGRVVPSKTPEAMIEKIRGLYALASESPFSRTSVEGEKLSKRIRHNAELKMHYVLHFTKSPQPISNSEMFEIMNPRDSKKRATVCEQSTAIIKAIEQNPVAMSKVTGIDAASNEIDCRPEVFAPSIRRIRQYRADSFDQTDTNIPLMRITYHAGEDFLDLSDGLRAIDEAVKFCEMSNGDRIGHALALGIDCEEWYSVKKNTITLRKQALLDNLTWLFGKMHQYNIYSRAAEDEIQRWFKKLFTEIYTNNIKMPNSILYSVDVTDYYSSLGLRGNDPMLYKINPDNNVENWNELNNTLRTAAEDEPWKMCRKAGLNYDPLSIVLYHYYHFNFDMKRDSDKIIAHDVPRCIVDAVSSVQEKMMYDISRRGICIECNPSSNFLIGTFKDYFKHPIFRFNNKYLYPVSDPRSAEKNPYIMASINTDDLGIFDTSLENEYALVACALEVRNEHCRETDIIPPDNIYTWLDNIRHNGVDQSFIKTSKERSFGSFSGS